MQQVTLDLIHITRNMATAVRISHKTPHPNRAGPLAPEKRSPNKTTKEISNQAINNLL